MSKAKISLNIELTNTDCDKVQICQGVSGADAGDIKKETLDLAVAGSSTVFTSAGEDKLIYIESDDNFDVNINGLGAISVKRLLAGSNTLKASFLSKMTITSLEIINPGTEAIKVTYTLA